jgi:hypothetical protein
MSDLAMDSRNVPLLLGLIVPTRSWTPQKHLAVSVIGAVEGGDWWTGDALGRAIGVSEGWGSKLLARLAEDRVLLREGAARGIQWSEVNPRWDRWAVEWRVSKRDIADRLAGHAQLIEVGAGKRFSSRSIERECPETLRRLREREDLDCPVVNVAVPRARRTAVGDERIRALRTAGRHLRSVDLSQRDDFEGGALVGSGPTSGADTRVPSPSATEEAGRSIKLPQKAWFALVEVIVSRAQSGKGVFGKPRQQLLALCEAHGWEKVHATVLLVPQDVYAGPAGVIEEVGHLLALADEDVPVPELPEPEPPPPSMYRDFVPGLYDEDGEPVEAADADEARRKIAEMRATRRRAAGLAD